MIRVKYIKLSGFKSIKQTTIELRPLNVLIGANGSGKSNLISLFNLIREIQNGRLQKYAAVWGSDSFLHYGAKTTNKLDIRIIFEQESKQAIDKYFSYELRLIPAAVDTLVLEEEKVIPRLELDKETIKFSTSHGDSIYGCHIDHRESNIKEFIRDWSKGQSETDIVAARVGKDILDTIEKWHVYHFQDTSPEARIRRRCYLHDDKFLQADGGNLAAVLHRIHRNNRAEYDRIISAIRQIAPWFGDFVLEPIGPNRTDVLLNWRDGYSDMVFGPHQLPDGALRAMVLIALLLQPKADLPSLMIIDEPELGLHPAAATIVAGLLESAALHTQVVIATQSPTFLDSFNADDVIVADRLQGTSAFSRRSTVDLAEWLDEYTLGELWQKNSIGGGPF